MDGNLGVGHKSNGNGFNSGAHYKHSLSDDAAKLTKRNALIKAEIAAVHERIAGLKAISGKEEYLSIPISFVSNPAPIILISTEMRLREANESFARLANLSQEDLPYGSDVRKLFSRQSIPRLEVAIARLAKMGNAEPFEAELLGPGGKANPVFVFPTKSGPTNNDCFVFFMDMTARKAMQKELAIRHANLTTLAEAIPQMIWVSGPEGIINYANEHFRSYTGICPDNAPTDWRQIMPAEERENISSSAFSLGQTYGEFQTEARLRNAKGDYLWHLLKVVPFFTNGGAAMSWLNLATEIDEQKRLADSLVVAEEQLRIIADAMPQIVWTADARGIVDFLNHRWFEYTGLTPEQSLHGGWRLLIHPEDLPVFEERWRRAISASEPFEAEIRLKRVLGLGSRRKPQDIYKTRTSGQKGEARRDYLWHLCRAVPLKTSQGQVIRWFGTWTEIDEHKARG